MKYLITGIKSGLGKYLYKNLPEAVGLDRNGFNLIKDEDYDVIVHCAFNKTLDVEDHYQYLEDNIFLTQKLVNLNYKKFIYISTIDVYPTEPNLYGLFKRFAESIVEQKSNTTILRCSMILGKDTKPNHVTRLKENTPYIGLSGDSTFNYILNKDILSFIQSHSEKCPDGIIDFVSNDSLKLEITHQTLKSNTQLRQFIYNSDYTFSNPIYNIYPEFNKSSLDNLKQYIND
jgi:nucleoside-diphosphate-sugar epimerase